MPTTQTHFPSKEIHLRQRPSGKPLEENFELKEVKIPSPREGEILIKNLWMSVDPYMRGRMNDKKSYIPPFEVGKVMDGGAIGEVILSQNPQYKVGDKLLHPFGWREYALTDGKGPGFKVLDPALAPLSTYLGILGMPGLTAWVGLKDIAQMKSGDTVFISGAAGAVGSLAGQLAKLAGCRVIGSAGSDEKVKVLTEELHFDNAFNYKKGKVLESLSQAAPDGIDVYFDNVGGDHLEAALTILRPFGRVAMCGSISQYNLEEAEPGPRNLMYVIGKRLTLRGFIVSDHYDRLPAMFKEVGEYLRQGKIVPKEYHFQGIEKAPSAFISMMDGHNIGKTLVKF